MTLNEYLKRPGSMSVSALREAIGAKSDAQIRQWQHGYAERMPGPAYCVAIERETGGLVSRKDLRKSDWASFWPELVKAKRAKAESKASRLEQIYVAQGKGGLIKIGRTRNLKSRMRALRKEFILKGDEFDRFEACEGVIFGGGPEYGLMRRLQEIGMTHSGREWFTGVSLEVAMKVARDICDEERPVQIRRRRLDASLRVARHRLVEVDA